MTATKTPIPDWLLTHISTTTGVDYRSGFTRRATPRTCRRCGRWTIQGLDADLCARPATVDPTPLTETGAGLAVLAGLTIWHLADFDGHLRIYANTSWRHERHRLDLVAEHVCYPTAFPRRPSNLKPRARTQLVTSEEPPF